MDRKYIAEILAEMAAVLELKGENPFKIRAYENASRIVESLTGLEELVMDGKLTDISGIGKGLAEHITELYKTGRLKELEKLKKSIPAGLFDIMQIPGVGAKRTKVFYERLGITTIGELEYSCRENRLKDLEGFGEKSQQKILQGIGYLKLNQGMYLYPYAYASALSVMDALKKCKAVKKIELAGSLRRKKETIKDIDILASTSEPKKVMEFFTKLSLVKEIIQKGETKSAVTLQTGINCDLRCVTEEEYPYALHHFTGSKEHNTSMRGRAKKMSLKMNEYGLFKGTKNIKCRDEIELFKKLGLSYISPELREDMGEIEAAENNKLPKLVEEKDIKGLLHVHSEWSDGVNTIEELAIGAKKKGYEYLAICDHSRTAYYAGGLKDADVIKQQKEIDSLNKKLKGITILKGIEVDILPDGTLDYGSDILKSFDIVIASVHSKFNMTEKEMTKRICKALSNKFVDILGHPTGRLLLAREPYPVDIRSVIDCAAENGKVIELNANPHRLDIDWRWGRYLKEKGVRVAICPDAHSVEGFDDVAFGVGVARKAWLEKKDVVNAWPLDRFMKLLGR